VLERKALVVDDDATLRLVAGRYLKKLGFSVVTVSNGKEAVDSCNQSHFDLILMDVQMPEMDGYEATREIRALPAPTDAPVPTKPVIVAVTASQDQERALNSGMDDFLFKPVLYDSVQRTVNKWFPLSA
jgi:CheY-like chemotaxis protein